MIEKLSLVKSEQLICDNCRKKINITEYVPEEEPSISLIESDMELGTFRTESAIKT
jgi:hypothetical protein